jgi:hypothetical protein
LDLLELIQESSTAILARPVQKLEALLEVRKKQEVVANQDQMHGNNTCDEAPALLIIQMIYH